jgi:EmrB/QacA subfamily drug resistance transporter
MKNAKSQRVVVAVVYVTAMFMAILDTTIVNVALPTIGRDLHAQFNSVSLVSIAYLVSLTVLIPASGWFGDRVGGRTALLWAIAIFTGSSTLCGLATNMDQLIIFRVLQGVGGAVMTPVGLAMLFRVYPPQERVQISSILAGFTALAPALGPVLGGLFTTYLSWRYVFFVNAPIGLMALIYGFHALDDHRAEHPGRLDIWSLILSGAGLGTLMYGISEGPGRGWSDADVLGMISLGALMLVIMVIVEFRAKAPLMDLHLLNNRLFASATSIYGLGSMAYLGALFLAALFFQNSLGLSAILSGLTTFPSAIGVMAGGQLVTRFFYRRIGPRRIMAVGFMLVATMMWCFRWVNQSTRLTLVGLIMFALGLGISFAFISAQAASMATITKAKTGKASAIFNAGKQLGGALGVALLSSVVAITAPFPRTQGHVTTDVVAYHNGFLAASFIALLAAIIALTVRDTDALTTLQANELKLSDTTAKGKNVFHVR